MKYCINCGNEILDEAVVCIYCEAKQENYYDEDKERAKELAKIISVRLKISALIWFITAVIQGTTIVLFPFAIVNGCFAIGSYIDADRFRLGPPRKLVDSYRKLFSPIFMLVYNFIFGGIIGVLASLFHLIATVIFVRANKEYFYLIAE